tara:strand:+ start:28 stop:603 length:576 start_codon:yes stop_codon:yes gene_type:complete
MALTRLNTNAYGSTVNLASNVTGTLATGNGGTGTTSYTPGITHSSVWRLTSDLTGSAEPISSNLEEVDTAPYATLGSAMTVSSGAFTFPATGYWWVKFGGTLHQASSEDYMSIYIYSTLNAGGSWQAQARAEANTSGSAFQTAACDILLDITDTTNQKVRFRVIQADTSNQLEGNSAYNKTWFTFVRYAAT